MKLLKKREKAQQLIEFLLVIPFMIIILGIMTEYAYALNINMTLTYGLKTVASSIYSDIKPTMSQADIINTVEENFIQYLDSNNVPTNEENNIKVGYTVVGQTAIFMARYNYIPAFTLPNVYFKFLPEKFEFLATTAVPAAFVGENNYNTNINSRVLDGIWSNTSSFSSLDSFNASKKGIMKYSDERSDERNNILFLLQNPTAPNLINPYALISWDGKVKKSLNGNNYNVDLSNGRLYECLDAACTDTGTMFLNYLKNNNYYNIIFVHDADLTSLNDLGTLWAYNKNTKAPIAVDNKTDISAADIDGVLKRTLALIGTNSLSEGNYDNLNVYWYNSAVSTASNYTLLPLGSMVFIKTSADAVENIINGKDAENYELDYYFGSKVN